jgi:hypothetical protein
MEKASDIRNKSEPRDRKSTEIMFFERIGE